MFRLKSYTGVLVTTNGGSVGSDDTEDAVYLFIHGRHGADTTVLLGCVDGGIALSPKTKIGGGGSSANLAAAGSGSCGHRKSCVGRDKAYGGNSAAAENYSGNGEGGRDKCFFHILTK